MKATPSSVASAPPCCAARRGAERRGPSSRATWGGRSRSASGPEALDEPGRRDGGDGGVAARRVEARSRRSVRNSSCTSRSTPSPCSSTTCSRGSSTWTRTGTSRRSWRRSERRRPARDRSSPGSMRRQACGRTSRSSLRSTVRQPALLRSRQRRGDRWLSATDERVLTRSRRVDVRRLRPARRPRWRRGGVRVLRCGHALSLASRC